MRELEMTVGVEVGRIVEEVGVVEVAVRRRMRRGQVLVLEENQGNKKLKYCIYFLVFGFIFLIVGQIRFV